MNIAIVVNPRSGRGKSTKAARSIESMLHQRGHTFCRLETGGDPQELLHAVQDADRVLVLGGDGTVHHLLPTLAQAQTPLYHFGMGTANLISKEFGMSKVPQTVVDHLESEFEALLVDLPTCNGTPFLIMVSVGIDASVIHRFQDARSHKGGYRAYIQPIIHEFLSPRPAHFTVTHDTQPPYSQTGIFIISNIRSYGGNLNPCPNADPSNGYLNAISIPCRTSLGAGAQYTMLKLGSQMKNTKRFSGTSFRIVSHKEAFVQMDGEKATQVAGLNNGMIKPEEVLEIVLDGSQIRVHSPL